MNPTLQKTLRFCDIIPDTVNRTSDYRLDASGKGVNVSRVLTQLGKKSLHLTQLGGMLRPLFLELCKEDGLALNWVESNSSIRFAYTLINGADFSVTELVEEPEPVAEGTEERLRDAFEAALPTHGHLIISGTKAAGFSDDLVPFMVRRAKEEGLKTIIDVKGKDLVNSLPFEPDIVKPNLYEFVSTFAPELVERNGLPEDETKIKRRITEIIMDLCARYKCKIILTRGSKKIWAAEKTNFFEADFDPVKPLNTTGSGDAFTAGLASALADGAALREAIAEGARCGRLNAQRFKVGTI
jgi:1-phosphofructokinase/tagatose 6-phosphate kinase